MFNVYDYFHINKLSQSFFLWVFGILSAFITICIVLGIIPENFVYVALGLQLFALLFFNLEYALYSFIVGLPFYLVFPHLPIDSFSSWRVVLAFLFLKYVFQKGLSKEKFRFNVWDRKLVFFGAVLILSSLVSINFALSFKKIIFIVNCYFIYLVAMGVLKTPEQISRAIKVSYSSLLSIVMLGYVQFISTFYTSTYYFWQYWATLISKAYYGVHLSQTLVYSNSWFTFTPGQSPTLRMFSILPDSHAFAVLALFVLPFAHAMLGFYNRIYQKILIWISIVLSLFAIVLSGTRGVWVGSLAAIVVVVYFYVRHYGRKALTLSSITLLIFVSLIVLSPVIQSTVSKIRSGYSVGNFVQRAESIYDLQESSNSGRIYIWKKALVTIVSAHPLLGVGFGNFSVNLNQSEEKLFNLPKEYISAHNFYLEILSEAGLIGLCALLVYIFKFLETFFKFFKKNYLFYEDSLVVFVVSAGLMLVWLWGYLFFDTTIYNDRVLIFFFLISAISGTIMKAKE